MRKKENNKIELYVYVVFYTFLCMLFLFAYRPKESILENRNLKTFPTNFTLSDFFDGKINNEIDLWFSDTIPFRDTMVSIAYRLKDINGLNTDIDFRNVVLANSSDDEIAETETIASASIALTQILSNNDIEEDTPYGDDYTVSNGVVVFTDKDNSLRAVEWFSGYKEGDETYSYTINLYKERFPNLNVYSMIIPTAVAYYCPDELKEILVREEKSLSKFYSYLSDKVINIDVYSVLKEHKDEDIYLKTDHHWSPLGAYYAAKEFARLANIKFNDLDDSYEEKVVDKYYGSLYRLTGNERLKDRYEKFVYYLPKDVDYTMMQYKYTLDENGRPINKNLPEKEADYINLFSNLDTRAYQIYLGNDNNTSRIMLNNNKTNRNLLILKDSFGNPLPTYLMYGFDNIHIVDFRYFLDKIDKYVQDNNITDILFVNSITNSLRDKVASKYRSYLQ